MAEGQIGDYARTKEIFPLSSGSYMWARNGSAALFVYSIFIEMQYEFIRPGTTENIGFSVGAD